MQQAVKMHIASSSQRSLKHIGTCCKFHYLKIIQNQAKQIVKIHVYLYKIETSCNTKWINSYICKNSQVGNILQDVKPNSNVLGASQRRTSMIDQKFLRVDSDFKNIVNQREQWSQGESWHENCDESVLKNCNRETSCWLFSKIEQIYIFTVYS